MVALLFGWSVFGLIGGGFVLGIVALCGIKQYGPEKIRGRSIAGLIINGLFLVLFVIGFITGIKNGYRTRQAMSNLQKTTMDAQDENRRAFDSKRGLTNVDLAAVGRVRDQMDTASKTLSGEDALVAQGMSGYLGRIQDVLGNFKTSMEALRGAKVLSLGNLDSVDQITERRKVVQDFLAANSAVADVVSNSEQIIQTQLEALNVSAPTINSTLRGFRASATVRNALILKIRQCDDRSGQSMLGILDILENNWGKWHYDPTSQVVNFDDTDVRQRYANFVQELKSAGEDEVSLQGRLVNLQ